MMHVYIYSFKRVGVANMLSHYACKTCCASKVHSTSCSANMTAVKMFRYSKTADVYIIRLKDTAAERNPEMLMSVSP